MRTGQSWCILAAKLSLEKETESIFFYIIYCQLLTQIHPDVALGDDIWDSYLNDLPFTGDDGHDKLILLIVEAHVLGVVKDAEKVGLDGVRVAGLTQNLQQRRVRHKEESWEGQTLLLQVTASNRCNTMQSLNAHKTKVHTSTFTT